LQPKSILYSPLRLATSLPTASSRRTTVELSLSPRVNLILNLMGAALVISAPFWLHELFLSYEEQLPLPLSTVIVVMLIMIGLNFALLSFVTRSQHSLRRIMSLALLAKLAAGGLYVMMVVRVYHYVADMAHYFSQSQTMTSTYVQTGVLTVPDPLWGTNFVSFLAQCLFIVTGSSVAIGVVFFSFLSFWGAYFFYRASCIALPSSRCSPALPMLIFLLPSAAFWTASISKDAVIMLGGGMVAYGFAWLNNRLGLRGYLVLAGGICVMLTVRPHMAALMAIAVIFPYVFGANRTGFLGIALKAIGIPVLVVVTWLLVSTAETYVDMQDFSQAGQVVRNVARNNRQMLPGDSTFGESLTSRMALAPFLLIRPFPFEVHNMQAAIASIEGLCLLVFFVRRRKGLYHTLGKLKSNPFLLFLFLYSLEFTVIFAAASSNFGLLNRQRVMLLPFALMLFLADQGTPPH
jgi:hypothetical protein